MKRFLFYSALFAAAQIAPAFIACFVAGFLQIVCPVKHYQSLFESLGFLLGTYVIFKKAPRDWKNGYLLVIFGSWLIIYLLSLPYYLYYYSQYLSFIYWRAIKQLVFEIFVIFTLSEILRSCLKKKQG